MARLTARQLEAKAERNILKALQASTFEVSFNILIGTPIDKGQARSGWFWVGEPNLDTPFGYFNKEEHVPALEHGHSDQAPKGMLRINALLLPEIFHSRLKP